MIIIIKFESLFGNPNCISNSLLYGISYPLSRNILYTFKMIAFQIILVNLNYESGSLKQKIGVDKEEVEK